MQGTAKRLLNNRGLRRTASVVTLALSDAAALLVGLAAAAYLLKGERFFQTLALAPILVAVWICILAACDLYDRARVRRNPGALLGAVLLWAGLTLVGAAIYPRSGLVTGEILLAMIFSLGIAGGARLLYERIVDSIYRRGLGLTSMILVGEAAERARVRRMLASAPGAYFCVGEVDFAGESRRERGLAALRGMLDHTGARSVILAGADRIPDDELLDLLHSLRLRGVQMRVVPGAIALMRGRPVLSQNMGIPLLEVRYPRLDNTQRALKRTLDIVGSVVGLVIFSPLLLAAAVLIKATSPGEVFFRQRRAGADGQVFTCYMFRSMYRGAEEVQPRIEKHNEADGAVFKIRDDPRVTPAGRFMRRWSIDELPQLWNVLKGEMSLVGPRPLPLRDFELMGEQHRRRLAATPGMTGYWQISGRSDLSFDEMVRLDLYYIQNWSLSFDLEIILRTAGAVLRRKGAY